MITQEQMLHMFTYDQATGDLIHRYTVQGGKVSGSVAGSPHNAGYRQICIQRKKYLVHRLVWLYHYGYMPGMIDHVNRNRSDNRIENLRECSYAQNHGNKRKQSNNTSGYKGITEDKRDGYWSSHIAGRHIGRFKTKEAAAAAYDIAAKAHFGEFALTNEMDIPSWLK